MSVSRNNLDLQRAMQVICQVSSHDSLQVVFLSGESEDLPGYVAYKGAPIAEIRLTSDSWPPREDTGAEEEIPENCVGVFEPARDGQTFFPLEDFVRSFDPGEYERGQNGAMYLRE